MERKKAKATAIQAIKTKGKNRKAFQALLVQADQIQDPKAIREADPIRDQTAIPLRALKNLDLVPTVVLVNPIQNLLLKNLKEKILTIKMIIMIIIMTMLIKIKMIMTIKFLKSQIKLMLIKNKRRMRRKAKKESILKVEISKNTTS